MVITKVSMYKNSKGKKYIWIDRDGGFVRRTDITTMTKNFMRKHKHDTFNYFKNGKYMYTCVYYDNTRSGVTVNIDYSNGTRTMLNKGMSISETLYALNDLCILNKG